ncbi:MAG: bacillithiol biosynthesis cysteine-adding enzyme BshC [Daejeonella sp.]
MKATYIDYSETNSFSPAVISYLNNDPKLSPFISHQPTISGFRELLKNKKSNADRTALVNVLKEQYSKNSGNPPSVLVANNIELLLQDNTYTVTTGHQLNIFTGPLYFIYKIVTAINLAKELKANFPDKNFVPVYWMATEDHDFEEINHTYIAGKKIVWDQDTKGATGRLPLDTIHQSVKEYIAVLGLSENAENLAEIIKNSYLNHNSLADATRYLADSLFAKYGLVILDADNWELKKQFASVMEQDIIGQNSFKTINNTNADLQRAGIEAQVNPREINFFYLSEHLRERIVFDNGKYSVLNTEITFSEEDLRSEIRNHPEHFSPNVVMRPLYQETILPNIAYIGGGAEIVYWLQLKQTFDFYQIDFPILILRNSALIVNESLENKLKRLDLTFRDVFKKPQDLQKEWVLKHSKHNLNLTEEWQGLNLIFEKLKSRAHKIDPTLAPSTEAVKARLQKAMTNLEHKLIKAEKRNYTDALTQIENIKTQLFPNGELQERSQNFGLFYVKHGNDFIASLINNFKPLEFKFTILEE